MDCLRRARRWLIWRCNEATGAAGRPSGRLRRPVDAPGSPGGQEWPRTLSGIQPCCAPGSPNSRLSSPSPNTAVFARRRSCAAKARRSTREGPLTAHARQSQSLGQRGARGNRHSLGCPKTSRRGGSCACWRHGASRSPACVATIRRTGIRPPRCACSSRPCASGQRTRPCNCRVVMIRNVRAARPLLPPRGQAGSAP